MTNVITAENLDVRFSGCHALRGVNLTVEPGTIFALLGENGAGKTTLIRLLTGFLKPSSGHCRVLGLDPASDSQAIRQRVGYVSDAPALYDWMQVGEIGWFAAAFYPDGFLERYRESVAKYGLPEDRKIKHLSKGQRAKVALSLAIAPDPELLILDEPTSGLDPLVRREFMESMLDRAATGRTVFLSSHQISEVKRVADTIAILHQGEMQIIEPLQTLRESVFEVTINVDDPLATMPELESPAILLGEVVNGRQRQWMVRDYTEEIGQRLRMLANVRTVQARPATLDEIFVAYTKYAAARKALPAIHDSRLNESNTKASSRESLVKESL